MTKWFRTLFFAPSTATGFFFGRDGKPAPREILRDAPFGRIGFANTDMGQLLDQVLTA